MSVAVLTLPVPGWYPDPTGTSVYRWWDGAGWTEGLHDGLDAETHAPVRLFADEGIAPTPAAEDDFILPAEAFSAAPAEPVTVPAEPIHTAPAPVAVAPEPLREAAPVEPVPQAVPQAAPAPMTPTVEPGPVLLGQPVVTQRAATPRPQRSPRAALKTRWSGPLAALPVVLPIAVGMVTAIAYAGGAGSNTVALIVIAAVTATLLLIPAFMFAEQDRRELRRRGAINPPSLAWLLLAPPIAYLIARRRTTLPG